MELDYRKWNELKGKYTQEIQQKYKKESTKEFQSQKTKQVVVEAGQKIKKEVVTVWKPIKQETGVKGSAWSKVGGTIVIDDDDSGQVLMPVKETWTVLPTCLDTSDEEWDDDEAYEPSDDENGNSNFSVGFRKWYRTQ